MRVAVQWVRVWVVLVGAGLAPGLRAEGATVFAAASLGGALDVVGGEFRAGGGQWVRVAYAGSSALARQILQGAPADVFISADAGWMDLLEGEGMIEAGTRFNLVGNRLALVSRPPAPRIRLGAPGGLAAALGDGYLAMALVDAVPAGIYGKQALAALGLWGSVAGQVVQADNVRAALMLVARGEARLGLVYSSDALAEPRVALALELPEELHDAIVYPAALVAGRDSAAARAFLAYLRGAPAQALLARHGFLSPPQEAQGE